MSPPPLDDDEPEIRILHEFDPDVPTPPAPPSRPEDEVERARDRQRAQAQLDRAEAQRLATRLTDLEQRVQAIEEDPNGVKRDRMLRQWRLFRRYIVAWLTTDASNAVDEVTLIKQWRRLRKFLAVWLREE